ncbi:hypothetical protein [Streptomyces sp. NPDC055099]
MDGDESSQRVMITVEFECEVTDPHALIEYARRYYRASPLDPGGKEVENVPAALLMASDFRSMRALPGHGDTSVPGVEIRDSAVTFDPDARWR